MRGTLLKSLRLALLYGQLAKWIRVILNSRSQIMHISGVAHWVRTYNTSRYTFMKAKFNVIT